ncbi:MAG: hypothetical protein WCZ99_02575 [Candidatus Paceibacterota bacterium]
MRDILKIIKEHFILLSGTGLFVFNLFRFNTGKYCSVGYISIPIIKEFGCVNPSTYYYYNDSTFILLTIGAIFIAIGLLKIYETIFLK